MDTICLCMYPFNTSVVEACLPDLFWALQDHVTLDFNNPVAVLCAFSDTADGLGKVQVHITAVIHLRHSIQSCHVACTCSNVSFL